MALVWLRFVVSAVLLILAGTKLAQFGDEIAQKTRLTGFWIGAVLLALATSLPELVADVSAGAIGAVNLAVGDILGSGMANMLILAIIDLIYIRRYRKPAVLRKVALSHAFTATLAILLTALVTVFIYLKLNVQILRIGFDTVILAVIYFSGVWFLFREQQRAVIAIPAPSGPPEKKPARQPLAPTLIGFALGGVVVLIAAPFMVQSAERIASWTGLGQTFFGTLFMAAVTSFPELVVSVSAIRIGAFDLAVGNLFGSNAANVAILFATDAAFRGGPLLSHVSAAHAVTGLFLILMMAVGLAGILFRAGRRYPLLIPDSILIIVFYVLGMAAVYVLSAPR